MKLFKVDIYPMNEDIIVIDIISINYPCNINTSIIVDKVSREVIDDFKCNTFVDARKFIKDLSKDIKVSIKCNNINKFGQYL